MLGTTRAPLPPLLCAFALALSFLLLYPVRPLPPSLPLIRTALYKRCSHYRSKSMSSVTVLVSLKPRRAA